MADTRGPVLRRRNKAGAVITPPRARRERQQPPPPSDPIARALMHPTNPGGAVRRLLVDGSTTTADDVLFSLVRLLARGDEPEPLVGEAVVREVADAVAEQAQAEVEAKDGDEDAEVTILDDSGVEYARLPPPLRRTALAEVGRYWVNLCVFAPFAAPLLRPAFQQVTVRYHHRQTRLCAQSAWSILAAAQSREIDAVRYVISVDARAALGPAPVAQDPDDGDDPWEPHAYDQQRSRWSMELERTIATQPALVQLLREQRRPAVRCVNWYRVALFAVRAQDNNAFAVFSLLWNDPDLGLHSRYIVDVDGRDLVGPGPPRHHSLALCGRTLLMEAIKARNIEAACLIYQRDPAVFDVFPVGVCAHDLVVQAPYVLHALLTRPNPPLPPNKRDPTPHRYTLLYKAVSEGQLASIGALCRAGASAKPEDNLGPRSISEDGSSIRDGEPTDLVASLIFWTFKNATSTCVYDKDDVKGLHPHYIPRGPFTCEDVPALEEVMRMLCEQGAPREPGDATITQFLEATRRIRPAPG